MGKERQNILSYTLPEHERQHNRKGHRYRKRHTSNGKTYPRYGKAALINHKNKFKDRKRMNQPYFDTGKSYEKII